MRTHAEPRGPGQKCDCRHHSAPAGTLTRCVGNEKGVAAGDGGSLWPPQWRARPHGPGPRLLPSAAAAGYLASCWFLCERERMTTISEVAVKTKQSCV